MGKGLDPVTYSHSVRVSLLAQQLADALGMSDDDRRRFSLACRFHDVGKLRVSRSILTTSQPLTPGEREQLRAHPLLGLELLRQLGWRDPRMLATVRSHHERWDGTGYPDGLAGERIPPWARMCAVIDAFDAMIQTRSTIGSRRCGKRKTS